MINRKKRKLLIIGAGIIIVIIIIILFWKLGAKSLNINNSDNGQKVNLQNKTGLSPITGLECENYNKRSFAVMMATDPETRPLSGIGQADMVIEMAVITNSITRLMAIFNCEQPDEIGSVRSSRHDYIPIALGLDAIFAHWGGSHFALDVLATGVIDNIDAMENPFSTYWQDWSKPMPHNGFTSYKRLLNGADKLNYRLTNNFEGYPHEETKPKALKGTLTIGFGNKYRVYYEYSSGTNKYKRWRGGEKEIDKNTGQQVEASVIIVMRASSRMIEVPDYNDVDVEGSGQLSIFQNGEEIKGTWIKEGKYSNSKLYFIDEKEKEIKLAPGKIWLEIVEPYQEVSWQSYD